MKVWLAETRMTQNDLANSTGQSPAYVSHIMAGRRRPSAEWCNLVAGAMKLSSNKHKIFHYLAAKQNGFHLTLTLPKLPPGLKKKRSKRK